VKTSNLASESTLGFSRRDSLYSFAFYAQIMLCFPARCNSETTGRTSIIDW